MSTSRGCGKFSEISVPCQGNKAGIGAARVLRVLRAFVGWRCVGGWVAVAVETTWQRLTRAPNRDNLVDNFSKHKDEVDKILAEGIKKLNIS